MARRLSETPDSIAEAAALLRAGGVIVMPTDTLYGIGADATSEAAVARVFAIKGRGDDKPLLVLAADFEQVRREVRLSDPAERLASRFWPGPLTLIAERAPGSSLARGLNPAGTGIGVRVPDRSATYSLIRAVGRPITAPSANRTGEPPAGSAAEALARLGDLVDLVLDGGSAGSTLASTIIDCNGPEPRLVRAGALPLDAIERALDGIARVLR